MEAGPVVETLGLGRNFGAAHALEDVSVSIAPGEAVGLIGRNGAGKSTLIRILAGLIRASAGSARLFGRDAWNAPGEVRSRVGYMSQTQRPPSRMAVGQVLDFCARMNPRWDAAYADQLVRLFEIPIDRRVGALSLGMHRRVGLTCALAVRPTLLLLDEPLSGLDVVVRAELLDGVAELVREQGTTTILATHALSDIERIATRVVVLDGGRLRLDATPGELTRASGAGGASLEAGFVELVRGLGRGVPT